VVGAAAANAMVQKLMLAAPSDYLILDQSNGQRRGAKILATFASSRGCNPNFRKFTGLSMDTAPFG
jgi:hypothetical protein